MEAMDKFLSDPDIALISVDPPKLSAFCRFIGHDCRVVRDPDGIRALQKECFLAETFGHTQFRVYKSQSFFKEKLGFFNDDETDVRFVNVSDDILSERAEYVGFIWVNFDEFKQQHRDWKQYWEWKRNRNVVRAELEEKFKFDTKHAMHLVRLMRMAEEILTLGEVRVRRPDAKELLEIRHGRFDYDWLLKWSEDTDNKLNEVYEKSTLRHSADQVGIDNLYRDIVTRYWKEKNLLIL